MYRNYVYYPNFVPVFSVDVVVVLALVHEPLNQHTRTMMMTMRQMSAVADDGDADVDGDAMVYQGHCCLLVVVTIDDGDAMLDLNYK